MSGRSIGPGLYTAPSMIAYQQTITVTASTGEGFKATATITLMPQVSPSVTTPTGVTAAAVSATEIDLSWTASSEAGGTIAGYCIYRNGTLAGTSTTTSYSDLGLLSSTSLPGAPAPAMVLKFMLHFFVFPFFPQATFQSIVTNVTKFDEYVVVDLRMERGISFFGRSWFGM